MSGHTPGEWHVSARGDVVSDDESVIAEVWGVGPSREERDANARLIAAAPRTVDALRSLVEIIEKAGLLNLSNGVQLGATIWYCKADERLDYAKAVLAAIPEAEA